jgi:hypothetical protein
VGKLTGDLRENASGDGEKVGQTIVVEIGNSRPQGGKK